MTNTRDTKGRGTGVSIPNQSRNRVSVLHSNIDMSQTYKIEKHSQNQDDRDSYCGKCDRLVKNNDKGIQCDLCIKWFHNQCCGISSETYSIVSEAECIDWYCSDCRNEAKQNRGKIKKFGSRK